MCDVILVQSSGIAEFENDIEIMQLTEIETARLHLRAMVASDWSAIFAYMSDPRVTVFLPEGRLDEEASRAFALKNSGNEGEAVAVVEKASGQMIGHMPFHR